MSKDKIQEVFQKEYNRRNWCELLNVVFGSKASLNYSNPRQGITNDSVKSSFELGKIEVDNRTIKIYEVILSEKIKLEQNRVGVRNLMKEHWKNDDGSFIVYHNEKQPKQWRFSYIQENYIFNEESGKTEKISTNPKRFTYLFGKDENVKTAVLRFNELNKDSKLNDLKDAFSVEKLSDEFFDRYKEHYQNFAEFFTGERVVKKGGKWETIKKREIINNEPLIYIFNNDKKVARDFCKKLLGRIVFLYFVQKKGWLGCDKNFMQNYHNADCIDLNELFFEALNKKRENDNFKLPNGKIVKVPFLNGGLFEKEYDKVIDIPQKLLSGFFNFLEEYNFTIDESDSEDKEIGIDPEMLSRIFENLLEDNKEKGAFYTPKEIVKYMCEESLFEYLATKLNLKAKELKQTQFDIENSLVKKIGVQAINNALDNVKICDPAIGSGAFPMGMLNLIFSIKEKLNPNLDRAQTKLDIIQNSIYGVDIEKGAVDIARLRFWLSLIIDEEKPKPLPNLDFKIVEGNSLVSMFEDEVVNIDWEILNDKKGSLEIKIADKLKETFKKLVTKQQKFFSENSDKQKFKLEIRNLKIELLQGQIELELKEFNKKNVESNGMFGVSDKKVVKNLEIKNRINVFKNILAKLEYLKNNENKPLNFFDWNLDFPDVMNHFVVKNNQTVGFDIVIGNPPYIQLQSMANSDIYKNMNYHVFERTGDIYCLFYERGWQLLKPQGHLCFITSNKWMRAGYGGSTRKFFAENTNPEMLIDFAGVKVFDEATVDVNILMCSKDKNRQETRACIAKKDCLNNLSDYFMHNSTVCNFNTNDSWVILSSIEQSIKSKIEKIGTPLKEWDINIYRGILTGYNEAFIIDGSKKAELVKADPKSAEIIRPLLRGRDIKRYGYEFADLYLIATFPSLKIDIEKYPAVKKHLLSFRMERLEQTGKEYLISGEKIKARKKTNNKWFETQDSISYWEDFSKQKICWKAVGRNLAFSLVESGIFITAPACFITSKHNEYLLAFLHSKVGQYFICNNSDTTGAGDIMLNIQSLEKFPIPKRDKETEQQMKKLLKLKDYTGIDKLVYKIYNLSEEEIRFIENQ